jgi:hypothetical protein
VDGNGPIYVAGVVRGLESRGLVVRQGTADGWLFSLAAKE